MGGNKTLKRQRPRSDGSVARGKTLKKRRTEERRLSRRVEDPDEEKD